MFLQLLFILLSSALFGLFAFDATKYMQSKWLHGSDLPLGQPIELTISGAKEHAFDDGTTRPVIEFLETEQALALNKTQTGSLIGLFGANADAWKGQRVTLTPVPLPAFQGKPTVVIGRAAPPSMPTFNGQPMAAAAPQPAAPVQTAAAPLGVGAPGVQFRQPGN